MKATVYDMADAIRDVLGLSPLYDKSVDYKKTDAQRFHQSELPLSEAIGFHVSELETRWDLLPDRETKQGWFGQIHARRGNRV